MIIIRLILPISAIIFSFFSRIEISIILASIYFLFTYFIDKRIFYRMKSKSFLFFLIFLLIVYPLTGENPGYLLPLGLNYDFELMFTSIKMCLRAVLLFSLFAQLNLSTSSYDLESLWKKLGIYHYKVLLAESETIMPTIKENLLDFWKKIKSNEVPFSSPTNVVAIFIASLLIKKQE